MGRCPHKGPNQQETPNLTRPNGKGGKFRRRISSMRQFSRLPGLLAVKMI